MKTYIKIICLIIPLAFLFFLKANSQGIIEYKGDTLITITPNNLKTINCIITDFELTKKEVSVYKNLVYQDSLLIKDKDSIISRKDSIISKKETYYNNLVSELNNNLKKEKNKKTLWTSILGGVAVILGILAIR